jgi:hypothetical protein
LCPTNSVRPNFAKDFNPAHAGIKISRSQHEIVFERRCGSKKRAFIAALSLYCGATTRAHSFWYAWRKDKAPAQSELRSVYDAKEICALHCLFRVINDVQVEHTERDGHD